MVFIAAFLMRMPGNWNPPFMKQSNEMPLNWLMNRKHPGKGFSFRLLVAVWLGGTFRDT